jgi:hypothetical protein
MSASRGIFVAPFDELVEPRTLVDLARRAEQSGWDGFFLWDHVNYSAPVRAVGDAWIALAAIAGRGAHWYFGAPVGDERPSAAAAVVGTASGIYRTFGYIGSIASATITGIFFHTQVDDHGLHQIALVLIGVSALVLAMVLLDRRLPGSPDDS